MKDFVKDTRQARNREILNYEEKGYSFGDKTKYLLINKIQVAYHGQLLAIGIRVSDKEPYFIYIHQGANINFSIVDIYKILNASHKSILTIVDDLKNQLLSSDKSTEFLYGNHEYKMIEPIEVNEAAVLSVPKSNIEVPYKQIITLLALIQSKSNSFYRNSSDANRKYVDGILRLLICLLSIKTNHPVLNDRGWIWNSNLEEFELRKEITSDKYIKHKYCLTQTEMDTIMNT